MQTIRAKEFTGSRPWAALDIARIDGATVRLHWSDKPYGTHVNDAAEVFAVLDGVVEMRYRDAGEERVARLETGDVFYAQPGDEHAAHPVGEARILVIERAGSV